MKMHQLPVMILALSLIGRVEGAVNCSTIVDCRTCTTSSDFLIPCQWCVSQRCCESAWSPPPPPGADAKKCGSAVKISQAYNCPIAPPAKLGFLDDFARTRALPFIAASSADTEAQLKVCLDNTVPNTQFVRRYASGCAFLRTECVAFLAFSPLDNAIVVTFRGTNGAVQQLADTINLMHYAQKDFQPVGGKVVAHFYDSFFHLWKAGLEADLRVLIRRQPTAELWVFGHSLGGSIASLAAAWISSLSMIPAERLRFISFGQPRTGNLAYAQTFDELVPYKYRVVHRGDHITKLPLRIPLSDSSLYHHRFEVWYNNDMMSGAAYEVCESADSSSCSASISDPELTSFANHLQYYNISLYSWFRSGCATKHHLKIRPRSQTHVMIKQDDDASELQFH